MRHSRFFPFTYLSCHSFFSSTMSNLLWSLSNIWFLSSRFTTWFFSKCPMSFLVVPVCYGLDLEYPPESLHIESLRWWLYWKVTRSWGCNTNQWQIHSLKHYWQVMGTETRDLVGESGLLGVCPWRKYIILVLVCSFHCPPHAHHEESLSLLYYYVLPAWCLTSPWLSLGAVESSDHGLQPGTCEPKQSFLPFSSLLDTLS